MIRLLLIAGLLAGSLSAQVQQDDNARREALSAMYDNWREQDNKRLLQNLADSKAGTEKEMKTYDGEIAKLTALYKDLGAALAEDAAKPDRNNDTLIEHLVSEINSQLGTLRWKGDSMMRDSVDRMMREAASALGKNIIDTAKYREYRDLARQAKDKTAIKPGVELEETIAKAKKRVPSYFEILAKAGNNRL